jgi:prepilin-type N-terminal cleavage/methylation domain-containing protein
MNNKRRASFYKQGFTLIELVVAFSIMAVLSTIGIASFVSYSQAQTLQQAVNDVNITLNTAKSDAIAQVKPNGVTSTCPTPGVLNGYQVVLRNQVVSGKTTGVYILDAVCNGSPDLNSMVTNQLHNVSFDSSTFVAPATSMTITFLVLTGGVNSTGVVDSNGNTNIVLDGVNSTQKTITVTPGGLIE